MRSWITKLASLTLGDIWSSLWRACAWGLVIITAAGFLGLGWSWNLFALCIISDLAHFIFYRIARPPAPNR